MSVDLSALPERVTVRAGERAVLELPSYAGSGNYWSAEALAGEEAARVTVGPLAAEPPPPPAAETEPPTAAPVAERAVIEGLAPGSSRWRLLLARRFGDRSPAAEHELEVLVTPAAG